MNNTLRTFGSLFRRKRKSSPCSPHFFGNPSAWRLCAHAHCPKDQNSAKPFPTKAFSTSFAPCLSPLGHRPLKTDSMQRLDPIVSLDTDSPRTSKLCPEPLWGLRGALPIPPIANVVFAPLSLAAFIFQRVLAFLTSNWLLYSRCVTHFFVLLSSRCPTHFFFAVIVQFSPPLLLPLLPFAAYNSFRDCLATGMPISINQGRSPPVLRNVTHIHARFLGTNFLCSQRQFLGTP